MRTLILLFLVISSANAQAEDIDLQSALQTLKKQECITECYHLSYEFISPNECYEWVLCQIVEWNEEDGVCESRGNQRRKETILCRDVGPVP